MVLEVAEGWWRVAKRRADKVKPPRVSAFLLSWPGCTRGYRNARRSRRMSPLDYDTTQRSTAPACNGCERTLRHTPAPPNWTGVGSTRSLRFVSLLDLNQPSCPFLPFRNISEVVPFPSSSYLVRTGQRRAEARCSPRVSLMGSRTDRCHLFSFLLLSFRPNSSLSQPLDH